MARITIEDCLEHVPNRFALVLMSAERTKQLMRGSQPLVHDHRDNKEIVTSLREIAAERVHYHEKEVHEFDPASEAEIRRAAVPKAYTDFLGCPVGASAPRGTLTFPRSWLERAIPSADEDMSSFFHAELDDADLDEEFAEETDLDKLFSKLDSSSDDDDDEDDDDEDEDSDDEIESSRARHAGQRQIPYAQEGVDSIELMERCFKAGAEAVPATFQVTVWLVLPP